MCNITYRTRSYYLPEADRNASARAHTLLYKFNFLQESMCTSSEKSIPNFWVECIVLFKPIFHIIMRYEAN